MKMQPSTRDAPDFGFGRSGI